MRVGVCSRPQDVHGERLASTEKALSDALERQAKEVKALRDLQERHSKSAEDERQTLGGGGGGSFRRSPEEVEQGVAQDAQQLRSELQQIEPPSQSPDLKLASREGLVQGGKEDGRHWLSEVGGRFPAGRVYLLAPMGDAKTHCRR